MKFEPNKHYELFGYNVVFIENPKLGGPYFSILKGSFDSGIDMNIDQNFLKNMDGKEMKRLEQLFKALKNYVESGDTESQDVKKEQ